MEIIWVLYLIVCNNTQCVKQVVDTHDTLALCEEGQVFYKQCFLLANMHVLRDEFRRDVLIKSTVGSPDGAANIHAGADGKKGVPYGGRIKMIDLGDAPAESSRAELMNKLVSPKGKPIDQFFSMTPDIISALVPKIRLFRV